MHAVRRTLSTAGLIGFLALAPAGTAWADPTPTPSATATATATPSAAPTDTASPTASSPSPSAVVPSDEPTAGGCDQNPVICQNGGFPVGTTTDCGQIGPGGEPASPPPPGVVCIAGGIRPGATGNGTTGVGTSGNGAGAPNQLPRTGPAPLLPTVTVGMWLVLLGVLAGVAGRRRTARI
jgi:hypothetical protein